MAYSTLAFWVSPSADKPPEVLESLNFSQFTREAVPHPGSFEAKSFLYVCLSSYHRYLYCILIPERVGGLIFTYTQTHELMFT